MSIEEFNPHAEHAESNEEAKKTIIPEVYLKNLDPDNPDSGNIDDEIDRVDGTLPMSEQYEYLLGVKTDRIKSRMTSYGLDAQEQEAFLALDVETVHTLEAMTEAKEEGQPTFENANPAVVTAYEKLSDRRLVVLLHLCRQAEGLKENFDTTKREAAAREAREEGLKEAA